MRKTLLKLFIIFYLLYIIPVIASLFYILELQSHIRILEEQKKALCDILFSRGEGKKSWQKPGVYPPCE